MALIYRIVKDRSGVTSIEYGLISAIISVALIAGVGGFSNEMATMFGSIKNIVAAGP